MEVGTDLRPRGDDGEVCRTREGRHRAAVGGARARAGRREEREREQADAANCARIAEREAAEPLGRG